MSMDSESEEILPSALGAQERERATGLASYISFQPGDTLKDGRYRPFRKLGEGNFASVWLARDTLLDRYVAIKIGLAWRLQAQDRELSLLRQLKDRPIPSHPGERHVEALLDDFHHEAQNVTHPCLVFKPFGRDLDGLVAGFRMDRHQPYPFARKVCIQALLAVNYLHQQNIMHGNIQAHNLLLDLTYDIDKESEDEIRAKNTKGNELNEPDEPFPLDDRTLISATSPTNARAVLVDLGCASTPANAWSNRYGYPVPYRAPEVVVRGDVNYRADIWALGCLVFQIITGAPLFVIEGWGDPDQTNIEHMYAFIEMLGPLPKSLRDFWSAADEHVNIEGELLRPFPEDERTLPLTGSIREESPEGMSQEEVSAFAEFMAMMICFDPEERALTETLLQHRWVTEFAVDR
ncbi:uncharacterized protein LDX57_006857 [Aspergillus melleus]|uniref:uncharacterized protein n=1 Tax=Aspergillus melleus TaxID=138277 RepID=UPI001E8CE161|nr:uncharacterized protein LDX57_006857 [Aspergillus melleus]KAH8429188.1 hypothetical protein LDX57_006857 [Aspergillus melleus]